MPEIGGKAGRRQLVVNTFHDLSCCSRERLSSRNSFELQYDSSGLYAQPQLSSLRDAACLSPLLALLSAHLGPPSLAIQDWMHIIRVHK